MSPSLVRQHPLACQFKGAQRAFERRGHERVAEELSKSILLAADVFGVVGVEAVELGEKSPDEVCRFFHRSLAVESKTGEQKGKQTRPMAGLQPGLQGVAASIASRFKNPLVCLMRGLSDGKHQRQSEEHTSELQSPTNLVCRLLLE